MLAGKALYHLNHATSLTYNYLIFQRLKPKCHGVICISHPHLGSVVVKMQTPRTAVLGGGGTFERWSLVKCP
jgi:hypothetical protein